MITIIMIADESQLLLHSNYTVSCYPVHNCEALRLQNTIDIVSILCWHTNNKLCYELYSIIFRICGEGDDYMGRAFLTASVSTTCRLYYLLY